MWTRGKYTHAHPCRTMEKNMTPIDLTIFTANSHSFFTIEIVKVFQPVIFLQQGAEGLINHLATLAHMICHFATCTTYFNRNAENLFANSFSNELASLARYKYIALT